MFRKLSLFCFVLSFLILTLGAYAHLSKDGLGCPDWPSCYGQYFISSDLDLKALVVADDPERPFNPVKIMAEISYRYLTIALAGLVLVLAGLAWRYPVRRVAAVTKSSLLLLVLGLQIAYGRWAVTSMADPVAITGLVLLEMTGFGLLFSLYLQGCSWAQGTADKANRFLIGFNYSTLLIVFLHIAYTTWLLANYANYEYRGMPVSWHETHIFFDHEVIVLDDKTLRRWEYVVSVSINYLLFAALALIARAKKYRPVVRGLGITACLLFLILVGLEIYGYLQEMPLWMVIAHNVLSACLMLPLIAISVYGRVSRQSVAPTVPRAPVQPISALAPTKAAEEIYPEPKPESLYLRLRSQLQRTRGGLGGLLNHLALGQKQIDRNLLEELETHLLMADLGISVTNQIIGQLSESLDRHQLNDPEALATALRQALLDVLLPCSLPLRIPRQDKPFVILVIGINGAGKTTTIGKLAKRLQAQGYSVMLAAGDTFRAAAVEQLQTWGERNQIQVVAQHTGADSASVIFDAVQSAHAKGVDVLIADTAGRLHTKSNLMDELKKVKRIMGRLDETAPHEVLLVLDAGTGQNALSQAKLFNEAVAVTGLALTKLDGTAKGGVIFALSQQLGIPVRLIGIGEGIDDLQDFNAESFVDALLARD